MTAASTILAPMPIRTILASQKHLQAEHCLVVGSRCRSADGHNQMAIMLVGRISLAQSAPAQRLALENKNRRGSTKGRQTEFRLLDCARAE